MDGIDTSFQQLLVIGHKHLDNSVILRSYKRGFIAGTVKTIKERIQNVPDPVPDTVVETRGPVHENSGGKASRGWTIELKRLDDLLLLHDCQVFCCYSERCFTCAFRLEFNRDPGEIVAVDAHDSHFGLGAHGVDHHREQRKRHNRARKPGRFPSVLKPTDEIRFP